MVAFERQLQRTVAIQSGANFAARSEALWKYLRQISAAKCATKKHLLDMFKRYRIPVKCRIFAPHLHAKLWQVANPSPPRPFLHMLAKACGRKSASLPLPYNL